MKETHYGARNLGLSTVSGLEIASGLIRQLTFVVSALSFLLSPSAHANQLSLLLNGKAVHLEKPAGTRYNEENWGAGVQYDFERPDSKWRPFLTVSGFKDSYGNPSYYAGGGTLRRFSFTQEKGSLHLDAGVVAFLMTRRDYLHGEPFLGALPVISFGSERVAINISYIPKVDPKMVPIFFFQLKIGLF